ncbi:MAG: hypothetical protein A2V85_16740 [Chloroflexi bacterium RBG_16_72_14]|nr:MAG: hypothetical protein A2V85_16740 [Chloroflexi bacterium RBG_16_72_14]
MKRIGLSLAVAALAILALAATVSAAGPRTQAGDQVQARGTLAAILGLTQAEVMELRQDGLTLAQIANKQGVDVQELIDALVARWTVRIDARVANGALTDAEAAELRAQLAVKAKAMVNQVEPGGMRGSAVGAGPGAMGGRGNGAGGNGTGVCDGSGPTP